MVTKSELGTPFTHQYPVGTMLDSIFKGSLLTALIQGALGGIGWALAGLPSGFLAAAAMQEAIEGELGAVAFGDLEDPGSNVSRLLEANQHFRMHEELGNGPGFFYLWMGLLGGGGMIALGAVADATRSTTRV